MNRLILIKLLIISIIISSCGTQKTIISYEDQATMAADSGNYKQAIINWQNYLNEASVNATEVNPQVYAKIGKAYYSLENYNKSESSFDQARDKNYADAEMYILMSKNYRRIDNLSKEITVLEYYRDHLSPKGDSVFMRNRLFETYVKSDNWTLAEDTWSSLDLSTQENENYLQKYFTVEKELNKDDQCDQISADLLKINKQNVIALDWLAKKYYNRAENRYQNAMAVYNKKKNNKTYKILLKELDMVTSDFKKSLKYFDVLWEMEDGKKYANYLANIYARFDDKKKSQYYKKFL